MNSQKQNEAERTRKRKTSIILYGESRKNDTDELTCTKQKLRHRYPEWISGCQWRKRGGINWENGINIYTLPYTSR